jgi:hypothetical protein
MSVPRPTIALMATETVAGIVDLGAWRRRRAAAGLPTDRVEAAVQRLVEAMEARGWRTAPPWLLTEIRAIQGCIALEEVDEAVDRAERLAARLEEPSPRRRAGR